MAIGYDALAKDFLESGQQMEAGLALNELAGAYREMGEFARAENAIRRALAIFEEISLPLGLADSWHKLGDLFDKQHQSRDAEEAYAKSIRLKLECSDVQGEGKPQPVPGRRGPDQLSVLQSQRPALLPQLLQPHRYNQQGTHSVHERQHTTHQQLACH